VRNVGGNRVNRSEIDAVNYKKGRRTRRNRESDQNTEYQDSLLVACKSISSKKNK